MLSPVTITSRFNTQGKDCLYGTAYEEHLEVAIYRYILVYPCYISALGAVLEPSLLLSAVQEAITYKTVHSMGLGYLRECISPIVCTYPTKSDRMDVLGVQFIKSGKIDEAGLFCCTIYSLEHSLLELEDHR